MPKGEFSVKLIAECLNFMCVTPKTGFRRERTGSRNDPQALAGNCREMQHIAGLCRQSTINRVSW